MNATPPGPSQRAFAQALLDCRSPVPAGLVAWNGADPASRLAVHRNTFVVSLVEALGETFPVVRRLVGDDFFVAMAGLYVRDDPPRSPVLSDYGDGFAAWLAGFEPARPLPVLPDLARLERARVRAFHAADVPALPAAALAAALADAAGLAARRWPLHPSLAVVRSAFAVVSLWAAHQRDDDAIAAVPLDRPEAGVVLRDGDDVLVLPVPAATADFVAALAGGASLGDAVDAAPGVDVATALALLIRHRAFVEP